LKTSHNPEAKQSPLTFLSGSSSNLHLKDFSVNHGKKGVISRLSVMGQLSTLAQVFHRILDLIQGGISIPALSYTVVALLEKDLEIKWLCCNLCKTLSVS